MGEILAAAALVVGVAVVVELEVLRRTLTSSLRQFTDSLAAPLDEMSKGAKLYRIRNSSRQSKVQIRVTDEPHPEIDSRPARASRLRIARAEED